MDPVAGIFLNGRLHFAAELQIGPVERLQPGGVDEGEARAGVFDDRRKAVEQVQDAQEGLLVFWRVVGYEHSFGAAYLGLFEGHAGGEAGAGRARGDFKQLAMPGPGAVDGQGQAGPVGAGAGFELGAEPGRPDADGLWVQGAARYRGWGGVGWRLRWLLAIRMPGRRRVGVVRSGGEVGCREAHGRAARG